MNFTDKLAHRFRMIFSGLPPAEKKLPIVKVDGKILTWNDVYKELNKKKSKLKVKALKKLQEVGII